MKLKKLFLGLIMGVFGLLPFFAGGQTGGHKAKAHRIEAVRFTPVTITDTLGREITISKPIRSIATLLLSGNEVLKLLDSWDLVVARDIWTTDKTIFPNLDSIPVLNGGSGANVDHEKLFEVHPDVLFVTWASGLDLNVIIEKVGDTIPVIAFDFMNTESLGNSVEQMGRILGKEEQAGKFIVFHNRILSAISERTVKLSDKDKPRVFLKSNGWSPEQLCTMTNKSTFGYSQTVLPGGVNIAAGLEGEVIWEVNPEWLVAQNPEVILVPVPNQNVAGKIWGFDVDSDDVAEAERRRIMNLDVFKNSDAVKKGQVFLYDPQLATASISSVVILSIAKWMHPGLFRDMNPRKYHQRYLDEFLEVNVDLSKHGTFFYPSFK